MQAEGRSLRLEIKEYSDLSMKEFLEKKAGFSTPKPTADSFRLNNSNLTQSTPSEVDWRQRGAVNPIKNQLSCGSCFAFSAVAAVEGRYAVKTGDLLKLSEQQVVDCDKREDNGCNGGLPWNVYA